MSVYEELRLVAPDDFNGPLVYQYFPNPSFEVNGTDGVYMSGSVATNLVPNPSFEVDTNSWGGFLAGSSISRITTDSVFGSACLNVAVDGTSALQGVSTSPITCTPGETYTASIYVKGLSSGPAMRLYLRELTSGDVQVAETIVNFTRSDSWQRIDVTHTTTTGTRLRLMVRNVNATALNWTMDAALIEAGLTVKPFFPSATQIALGQITWTGTAHNSSSELRPVWDTNTGDANYAAAAVAGEKALRVLAPPRQQGVNFVVASGMPGGVTYTASATVTPLNGFAGQQLLVSFYSRNAGGTLTSTSQTITLTDGPQRISLTWPFESNADRCWFIISAPSTNVACNFFVDAVKIGVDSEYFDGSQPGCRWAGTAHNSVSQMAVGLPLHDPYWNIEELELPGGARRDNLVTSSDADGALPADIATLDPQEITARIRLAVQTTEAAALDKIGALTRKLRLAEELASGGYTDPIADTVIAVYRPAGESIRRVGIPLLAGEIDGLPRTVNGDDAGWFLRTPIANLKLVGDPCMYGDLRQLYSGSIGTGAAPSVTVPGGAGDASPWTKVTVTDTASVSRARVILAAGNRQSGATAEINGSAFTVSGYAGSISGSYLQGTVSSKAALLGKAPQQTSRGNFRLWLTGLSGVGKVRVVWAKSGGARQYSDEITVFSSSLTDQPILDVSTDTDWDIWIEAIGVVSIRSVLVIPSDSVIDVTAAGAGEQLTGPVGAKDALLNTASTIHGTALDTGAGNWSVTGAATWAETSNGATRTATGQASPITAVAGSATFGAVEVSALIALIGSQSADTSKPIIGVIPKRTDDNNYLIAGLACSGPFQYVPGLWLRSGGTFYTLWLGETINGYLGSVAGTVTCQVTTDGRWWVKFEPSGTTYPATGQEAAGQFGEMIVSTTATGIHDWGQGSTPGARFLSGFRANSLVAVTPPPLASGEAMRLIGPRLLTPGGADYPYVGDSGLRLTPGANNNLTILTRRGMSYLTATARNTDALTLLIEGRARYIRVPG